MKINYYCPVSFEPWDYRNYDSIGIGGSETNVCETSWRLAKRGYNVKVFAPLGEHCDIEWQGTRWLHLDEVNPKEEAIWILHRTVAAIDNEFNGRIWVMMQDVDFPDYEWTPERVDKIELVMALCETHKKHLCKEHPQIADKVKVSGNGIRSELFAKLHGTIERNYKRCMYASSPDRGLAQAVLPLWPRILEVVPDAELYIYYGFNNIDKIIAKQEPNVKYWKTMEENALNMIYEYPNIHFEGRVGQVELYKAWLSSAVWPHFSRFAETGAITSMEAQAGGAIPVTKPWWAVGENVKHGFFVNGDPYGDPLCRASLVAHTVQLLLNPELQNSIRYKMMSEARIRFSWGNIVRGWSEWL